MNIAMSAFGPKQTLLGAPHMSAYDPKRKFRLPLNFSKLME